MTLDEMVQAILPSLTVGQHDKDPELRTDGRPQDGETASLRTSRVFLMMAPEDVERLEAWAGARGVSKSTAGALMIREILRRDGF